MAFGPPAPPVDDDPGSGGLDSAAHERLSILARTAVAEDRVDEVRLVVEAGHVEYFDTFCRVHANTAQRDRERQVELLAASKLLDRQARERAESAYEDEIAKDAPRSWVQVPHDAALAMRARPMPNIGHMADYGENMAPYPLIYSGKINDVHGDSEAGKSWFALHIAVQEMSESRNQVIYLDFEDDAGSVYQRLIDLGCSEDTIRSHFTYINPTNKLNSFEQPGYLSLIATTAPHTLAVVDGVTEAMALEGLTGRDEGEVAKWHSIVTKPLAAAGWGVLTIDHTPHGETRAIGSQHKKSAITGVSYLLDSIAQFAPGQNGMARLKIEKDRPGWCRQNAEPGSRPQWYGDFTLDGQFGLMRPNVWPWKVRNNETTSYIKTPPIEIMKAILAFLKASPGVSNKTIREAIKGKNETIDWALEWLLGHQNVRVEKGDRRAFCYYFDHDLEPGDGGDAEY